MFIHLLGIYDNVGEDSQACRVLAVEEVLENIKAGELSSILWCVCGGRGRSCEDQEGLKVPFNLTER